MAQTITPLKRPRVASLSSVSSPGRWLRPLAPLMPLSSYVATTVQLGCAATASSQALVFGRPSVGADAQVEHGALGLRYWRLSPVQNLTIRSGITGRGADQRGARVLPARGARTVISQQVVNLLLNSAGVG
jgi:hypothetical protein